MTWTYTDDYYREYTRATWNESAEVFVQYLRVLEPFGRDLLEAAAPKEGERALDIATGPGEPAMTLAAMVGPRGHVTGIDLSERMVEVAQRVAKARGMPQVRFEVMDAERLAFADTSFDLAVSRFGFQIITDPEKAAKEAFRVLRPGGRIAVSVWGPGERCPAIHAIIGPMLEHAEPDETGYLPTPYEMGGPGEMVSFLEAAGFEGAEERRRSHDWTFRDEPDYFRMILEGTPVGHSLREEPEEVQREVLAKTRANVQRWKRPDGSLALPAEGVVVTARRP